MSLNDPHLEAQMELESRYPTPKEDVPPTFRRNVLLAFGCVVALVAVVWIALAVVR